MAPIKVDNYSPEIFTIHNNLYDLQFHKFNVFVFYIDEWCIGWCYESDKTPEVGVFQRQTITKKGCVSMKKNTG